MTNKPKMQFGETIIENINASDDDPCKRGVYVRTIRRTGRMNPGVYVEVTDRNGKFWQWSIECVKVVTHD